MSKIISILLIPWLVYSCSRSSSDSDESSKTLNKTIKEIQSIALASDYTTLFVINARDFEHFVIDAEAYEPIDNLYYYVIDSQNQFLSQNSDIPEWLIGQSLLVDHNNRVKLIGPPYSTDDMTKAFNDITGVN